MARERLAASAPSRRELILDAALVQFLRFGFRRTAMEDVAREAGVSRATLYTCFRNKDAIFRELSEGLHARALAAAEQALGGAGPLARRIGDAIEARTLPFLEIVDGSSHGGEISDESSRLCGDLVARSEALFQKRLAAALRAAARRGELDLRAAGTSAPAAAEALSLATLGLKHGSTGSDDFRRRLRAFLRIFLAGLGAD